MGNTEELPEDKVDDIFVLQTVRVGEGTDDTGGAVRVREGLDQASRLLSLLDGGVGKVRRGHEGVSEVPVPVTDKSGDNPLLQLIRVGSTNTLQGSDRAQGGASLITEGKARTSVFSVGDASEIERRRFGDGTEGTHGSSGDFLVVDVTGSGDDETLTSHMSVHEILTGLGGDGANTLGVTSQRGSKGGGLEGNRMQVVHEERLRLQSQRAVLSEEIRAVGIQVLTLSHGLNSPRKNLDRFVGISAMGNNTHLLTVSEGSQNDTLLRGALGGSNFAQQVAGSSELSGIMDSSSVHKDTNRAGLTSRLASGNSDPIGKGRGG